jgi:phenylalanyl-tRNA synthetase beta chain
MKRYLKQSKDDILIMQDLLQKYFLNELFFNEIQKERIDRIEDILKMEWATKIKKSILKHFDIKQEVLFADFNWNVILKSLNNKIKFAEIPKYPEVRRDLALLVDEAVAFEEIYNCARQTEKSLLKDITLFDVYVGKNLPEGKKSYAVSFTIQDSSITLTDAQIEKIMSKLQSNFETQLGAQLR